MGIEMEGQTPEEHQQIRTRELQKESLAKLNQVNDMVNDINLDGVTQDTQTIKNVVMSNLENQANLDIMEFFNGQIDLDEILQSELEAYKSDYLYCMACKNYKENL